MSIEKDYIINFAPFYRSFETERCITTLKFNEINISCCFFFNFLSIFALNSINSDLNQNKIVFGIEKYKNKIIFSICIYVISIGYNGLLSGYCFFYFCGLFFFNCNSFLIKIIDVFTQNCFCICASTRNGNNISIRLCGMISTVFSLRLTCHFSSSLVVDNN